jgi:hypothetical protein
MSRKLRRVVEAVLVLVVLGAGVGVLRYLRSTRPEVQRAERPVQGLLVETQAVRARRHEVVVRAHGTVIPALRVTLQPELSGRIVWHSPALVPGGRLPKNAPLVRIDPRDYELALQARNAEVSRTALELRLEHGRQEVARKEWELFGETAARAAQPGAATPDAAAPTAAEDGGLLALRDPQVKTAEVAVQSARSALDRARLDLSRTVLRVPFNAMVIEERVERSQLVTPQAQLATLIGTDRFWVQVSVPIETLAHIALPGNERDAATATAVRVWQQVGGARVERSGRVLRLLPDLDAGGAMARLLVEIDDPLGLAVTPRPLPMLLNSYVNVEIAARPIERAIEVRRAALREGDRVFVAEDEKLRIRDVEIVWRMPDAVLIGRGIRDGERVVTSRVAAPVDGMAVRVSAGSDVDGKVAKSADERAPEHVVVEDKL